MHGREGDTDQAYHRLHSGLPGRVPADQATVRRLNLSLLMHNLASGGPRSRARLAEDTGLNKATVSSLVSELAERGLVAEGGVDRTGVGRPSRSVQIDPDRLRSIGLELNVDYVAGVLTDLTGTVLARVRQTIPVVDLGPARGLGRVADVARALVQAAGCGVDQVETLTLSVPGMIDIEDGILYYAPNLRWRQVDVVHTLMGRLGWPRARVRVDNDANLGAMAEFAVGRSAGSRNLLYLVGEIGVGAGLIINGQLQRGATGFAGEVGHMPIGQSNATCGCGRHGCWEMSVGLKALAPLLPDIAELTADAPVFGGFDIRLAEIVRRADAGDRAVLALLADMGRWLGVGASVLANVLDPEVIVLGGHFAALAPHLAVDAEREFASRVLAEPPRTRLEFSALGYEAPALGAAHAGLDLLISDPSVVQPAAQSARQSVVQSATTAVAERLPG